MKKLLGKGITDNISILENKYSTSSVLNFVLPPYGERIQACRENTGISRGSVINSIFNKEWG